MDSYGGRLVLQQPGYKLVQRFVSPFQVKLRVAGKVEAHKAAVQMVWGVGSTRLAPGVVDVSCG